MNRFQSCDCQVKSDDQLDAILESSCPCFTREGDNEIIVNLGIMDDNQKKELNEILGDVAGVDDFGKCEYVHFWK